MSDDTREFVRQWAIVLLAVAAVWLAAARLPDLAVPAALTSARLLFS